MANMKFGCLLAAVLFAASACQNKASSTETSAADQETPARSSVEKSVKKREAKMVEFETNMGSFKVELYADKAPITVDNFLKYVESNFFEGLIFHRVIDGFMVQGGGFTANMQEKDGFPPIKNESGNGLSNEAMTLAMARTNDPDSASSQFFINLVDNDYLNGSSSQPGYAVFGKVVEGQEVIKKMGKVETTTKGFYENVPVEAIEIKSTKLIK